MSALLILGMLGYTLNDAFRGTTGPPVVSVRPDSVVPSAAGHIMLFTLRNDGGETAAQVHVRGRLLRGDSTVEESEAVIDYVPEDAKRSGALQFAADPAGHALELRVLGFDLP